MNYIKCYIKTTCFSYFRTFHTFPLKSVLISFPVTNCLALRPIGWCPVHAVDRTVCCGQCVYRGYEPPLDDCGQYETREAWLACLVQSLPPLSPSANTSPPPTCKHHFPGSPKHNKTQECCSHTDVAHPSHFWFLLQHYDTIPPFLTSLSKLRATVAQSV
jgi:hypothetical protein